MRVGRASGATMLVLGLLVAAASACNLLTGVGDLAIDDGAIAPIERDARVDDDASAAVDGGADGATTIDAGAAGASVVAFLIGTNGDAGPMAQPGTIPVNGGTPKAIGCATSGAYEAAFQMSPPAGGSSNVQNGPYRVGNLSSRAYGSTFVYLDSAQAGGDNGPALFAVNETSDCASNPPKRIDRKSGADTLLFFPRFSWSGARLAYIEASQSFSARVLATSPAGGPANIVRAGAAVDAGSGQIWISPPAWNGDEIIWVESGPMGSYLPLTVMHAKDDGKEATTAQPLSTCDRYIEQIEIFSRSGQVLAATVASKAMWTQSNTSTTILVHPIAQGCATGKPLVTETSPGTVARDVAVSPDGNFIAFASNIDTPAASRTLSSPMNIWIVDSSGTSAPVHCSSPVDSSVDEVGPQWLASGTKLVWMRAKHDQNARESIMVADVAGGMCSNVRPLVDDEPGGTRYLLPANAGMACNVSAMGAVGASNPRGAQGSAIVALAGVVAMAIRRRRGRACSSSR